MHLPNPVYQRPLFNGRASLIVYGAPTNWRFAGKTSAEMDVNNPGVTALINGLMERHAVKRAFAPAPAFNAEVVTDKDLHEEILPGFFRGANADGVILTKPGDAYFLASADCLTTAVYDRFSGFVAGLHCGRDALIDRKRLRDGENARKCVQRKYSTVIDAGVFLLMMMHLYSSSGKPRYDSLLLPKKEGTNLDRFDAFLAAGIRPDSFAHPLSDEFRGRDNRHMIEWLEEYQRKDLSLPKIVTDHDQGKIDLFALVRHDLTYFQGCRPGNILEDTFDTATSKDADGEFLFHSNRRDRTKRNLVILRLN